MRAKHFIRTENNIVFVTLKGAFNGDDLERCHKDILAVIQAFGEQPFAVLTDITEFGGATPDAYDAGNAFNVWLGEQRFVAKAVLTHSDLMVSIARQRTPALNQQNLKAFDRIEDAIVWLQSQLADAQGYPSRGVGRLG